MLGRFPQNTLYLIAYSLSRVLKRLHKQVLTLRELKISLFLSPWGSSSKTYKTSFTDQKRGFSLIEMMVVLAIMGMLATTAKPTFDGMQARARRTEAKIHLPTFVKHLKAYKVEHGTFTIKASKLGLQDLKTKYYDIGFHWCATGVPGFRGVKANPPLRNIATNYNQGQSGAFYWCLVYKKLPTSSSNAGTINCSTLDVDGVEVFVGAIGNIDNDKALDSLAINLKNEIYLETAQDDVIRTNLASGSNPLGTATCQLLRDRSFTSLKKLN